MSDTPKPPQNPNLPKGDKVDKPVLKADASDRQPTGGSGEGFKPVPPSKSGSKKSSGLFRKLAIGFVGLVVLLIVGLLVAPSFVDWNSYKAEIEAQAKAQAGLTLKINGDISLSLLPTPALSVADVSLANAEGGQAETVVSLDALEVRVALGPLLGGTVQVETIRLVKPRVVVEKLADGETNIEKLIAGVTKAQSGDSGQSLPPRPDGAEGENKVDNDGSASMMAGLQLDNFTIIDGEVLYRDLPQGSEEKISAINTKLMVASLEGPFQVQGSLNLRGVVTELDLLVRKLIQGRTAPFSASLKTSAGAASLSLNGAVTELDSAPKFKGKLDGEGQNLGALIQGIMGPSAPTLPGFTGQPFSLSIGNLFAGATAVTVQDLALSLGSSKATGGATLDIGKMTDFTAELSVGQVDLDQWLSLPDLPGKQARMEIPAKLDQQAQVSPGHQAKLFFAAAGQATAKPKASPLIPANMAGSISAGIAAIKYKGEIIQQTRLSAEVANSEITLSQASARLPGSTEVAAFGFISGSADKPRFEGDLEVNAADLRGVMKWLDISDQGLPSGRLRSLKLRSQVVATPEQVQIAGVNMAFDASRITGGITLALRERLAFGADFNLDSIDLDAYLPASAKSAAEPGTAGASDAKGAANAIEAKPASDPVSNALAGLKVLTTFDANIRTRVGKLIYQGKPVNDIFFDGAIFNGDLTIKSFVIKEALGGSVDLRGGLSDLGTGPKMQDLRLSATVDDLQAMAKTLALDLPDQAKGIRQASVSFRGNGPVLKPTLNTTLKAAGATLRLDGAAGLLPVPGFNGQVSLKHGNLESLLKTLKINYDPAGPLGELDLVTKLQASPTTISLDDLTASLGQTTMKGNAKVQMSGAKPDITLALGFGQLDLNPLLPKSDAAAPPKGASAQGSGASAGGSPLRPAGGHWPTEPLDLSGLQAVDARVAITAGQILYDRLVLREADLALTLKDGLLKTDRIKGVLFGGKIDSAFSLNAKPVQTSFNLGLDGLQVGQALQAVTGKGVASGTFGANLDVAGAGGSVDALIKSLNGKAAISANKLDASSMAEGSVLSPVLGLVMSLNRVAAVGTRGKGAGLADVTGSFLMTNGVAVTEDLTMDSSIAKGLAKGNIDLPAWTVDLAGDMNLAQNAVAGLLARAANISTETKIPFSVRGPLDNPNVDVKTAALGGAASGGVVDKLIDKDSKVGKTLNKIFPGLGGGEQQQQQPAPASEGSYGTPDSPPPPADGLTEGQAPPPPPTENKKVGTKDLLRGVLGF